MPKKKTPYQMADEVKGHPVVVKMQKDDINDAELIAIMDEFKKVAKTKDANKKKAIQASGLRASKLKTLYAVHIFQAVQVMSLLQPDSGDTTSSCFISFGIFSGIE